MPLPDLIYLTKSLCYLNTKFLFKFSCYNQDIKINKYKQRPYITIGYFISSMSLNYLSNFQALNMGNQRKKSKGGNL